MASPSPHTADVFVGSRVRKGKYMASANPPAWRNLFFAGAGSRVPRQFSFLPAFGTSKDVLGYSLFSKIAVSRNPAESEN